MNDNELTTIAVVLSSMDEVYCSHGARLDNATLLVGENKVILGWDEERNEHLFVLVKKP